MNYLQTRATGDPPHHKAVLHALRFAAFHRAANAHRGHSFALCTKSVMTYSGSGDESDGQTSCTDASRGRNASIFQAGEALGRISSATIAAGEKIVVPALPVESETQSGQSLFSDCISVLLEEVSALHSGRPGNRSERD